jgi:plastocyanin
VNIWHANDTTITRVSEGVIAVEGITLAQTLLPTTATDGATVTFNLASNNKHQVTIAGNRTLALSNTTNVPVFSINIKQDATGSRTVTWFSWITWAGGSTPTLSTGANKTDSFGFQQVSAGVYIGFVIAQNI